MVKRVSILGSTGSIGCSALDVIRQANAGDKRQFEVVSLTTGSNAALLAEQAIEFGAEHVVVADEAARSILKERLSGTGIEVAAGDTAIIEAAERPCDLLLAAIVGIAGLPSTLAAVKAGHDVAIANKESVVAGGGLIFSAAQESGSKIIPVDSEHNAIFQILEDGKALEKVTITASGGPFRAHTLEQLGFVTPSEAAAHPNWSMGIKNSIDSATLMNKALEFIEASYLFRIPASQVDVLIHPESIIHGMAHFSDGSVLAQLSTPDMRVPISYALGWPNRIKTNSERLNLAKLGALRFETVDETRFPAIRFAKQALDVGFSATTVLNCANEAAVAAFIEGNCKFLDISWTVGKVLETFEKQSMANIKCNSLEDIQYLDEYGRRVANEQISARQMQVG